MYSTASIGSSSSEEEVSSPPHFSLAYLFLWLSTLSLALAGWILVMILLGVDLAKDIDGWDISFYGRHAFVLGTGLAGVVLLTHWWRQGVSYTWQPGDMLLVFMAAHELIRLLAVAVDVVVPPSNSGMLDENQALIYEVMSFSQFAVAVGLFAVGAGRPKFSLLWRIGFGVLMLINLYWLLRVWPLPGLGANIGGITILGSGLQCVGMLYVLSIAAFDAWQSGSREWLHWTGVATWAFFMHHWWLALLS